MQPARGVKGHRGRARVARRWVRGGGFTLVELLVALVVLMIGVYAMVRIFPSGFGAIESGQQRTRAAQLADAEIARWKLHPDTLPDAIIATNYDGELVQSTLFNDLENLATLDVYGELAARTGGWDYRYPSVTVDDLRKLDTIAWPLIYSPADLTPSQFDAAVGEMSEDLGRREATPHPNWQPNSIYLPRTIIGERLDVRRLGQTSAGVPFYLLSHAPIDQLRRYVDPVTGEITADYVDIYDARPWQYVPGANWETDLGRREFTVDATGNLYVGPSAAAERPNQERFFKIDFTDPATRQRVFGLTLSVPAGSVGPAVPTAGDVQWPRAGMDGRTMQVHERLVPLTQEQYESYTVGPTATPLNWPRNAYYVDPETLISGRIMFSPLLQLNPLPTDITQVKVDYRVLDWQILVFDVSVPEDGVVQLPVRHIKGPDYVNPPRQERPQEVARGIKRFYDGQGNVVAPPDPKATWAYVVAVDRQTGEVLTDHEGMKWPTNPFERLERFRVNYRDGLLYFNYGSWEVEPTFSVSLEANDWVHTEKGDVPLHTRRGRTYRVFCRAQEDWAVQLMVAARQYARSSTDLPGGPPVWGGLPGVLTYSWPHGVDADKYPDSRQLYFPLCESRQVVSVDYYYADETTGQDVYVTGEIHTVGNPQVTDLGVWACPLTEPLANKPNEWGPIAVRGISVRARAAWVTTGRDVTLQDLAEALANHRYARASLKEKWHQVVVTSYLTRTPL